MSNAEELEAFRASLPNPDTIRSKLLSLKFFALCPNGKRIPVEKICEEYAKDPKGIALRSLEDRLVLVLQAVFPGIETPYWHQAFYMSTGKNSGMPNTWLPFDGIVLRGHYGRPPPPNPSLVSSLASSWGKVKAIGRNGKVIEFDFGPPPPKPKLTNLKPHRNIFSETWFSKYPFVYEHPAHHPYARLYHNVPAIELTIDEKKDKILDSIYGSLYLPETDYLREYDFSRFGTLSYALASHKLGSDYFQNREGRWLMPKVKNTYNEAFKAFLLQESKIQPCFLEMSKTYPITKPYQVNQYIEKNTGFSYMNAFRQEGIFPPGLSFLNTPITSLGYSMPLVTYEGILKDEIKSLWRKYKKGEVPLDSVREVFMNPKKRFKGLEEKIRSRYVLPNEPNVLFKIHEGQLNGALKAYYGGTRRRHKKMKRRATKKA